MHRMRRTCDSNASRCSGAFDRLRSSTASRGLLTVPTSVHRGQGKLASGSEQTAILPAVEQVDDLAGKPSKSAPRSGQTNMAPAG